MRTLPFWVCLLLALGCEAQNTSSSPANAPRDTLTLTWEEYQPRSTLVVPEQPVPRAKYPFIDVHSHQWRAATATDAQVEEIIGAMDDLNMAVMVNLSGGSGTRLQATVAGLEGRYPNRFVTFANIDFDDIDAPDWTERTVAQLEQDIANGARGLKIFKNLGLTVLDSQGERVHTDDPRLDPIWAKCGELGVPVLIHTGEPSAFFEPHDRFNERWLELKMFPNRARPADQYPPWETIMAEQHRVFRKHPGTTFINAHFGWMANDLARLGRLLDEMPNVYVEFGAIIAELGRQPRFAHTFFVDYKERILFGKDSWRPEEYPYFFRLFETDDDYFEYYRRRHAFWRIYGLGLPDEVLRHIYYKNALRIIPGLDRSLFPTD